MGKLILQFSNYCRKRKKYRRGSESDIKEKNFKQNGNDGDFIIYRKHEDKDFPVRICYLTIKLEVRKINKLQIRESKEGLYSLLKHNATWFETVSELIDGSEKSYRDLLRQPFLGLH